MTDAALALSPREAARTLERVRAKANSRRVRRLRTAVPVAGGVIALALTAAAIVPKLIPFQLAGLSLTADGLVMNEPRLAGSLGEGRRYEVVAARAVQSLLNPSRLSLEGLSADLDMGATRVNLSSALAAYDTETEVLDLSDGVVIASTDGNEARLKQGTVFLKEGRAHGTNGITVASPRGRIRAGGIDIVDGGALIRFTGGVSITVDPAR